jgi:hypothetical protein
VDDQPLRPRTLRNAAARPGRSRLAHGSTAGARARPLRRGREPCRDSIERLQRRGASVPCPA